MIDLGAARDLGGILSACWALYRTRFAVFATIALAVVVPMDIVGYGLIEGHISGGFDTKALGGGLPNTIIQTLVTVPLITGAHVFAVMRIADGEEPSAGRSLGETAGIFPVLLGTVILSGLGVALGTIAVILPGIYLYVRWYVAVQSVVVEGSSPAEALGHSGRLVKGQWWRVFGISLIIALIGSAAGVVAGIPLGIVAAVADSGPILLVGSMVGDTVVLSFTALAGTLLYFDLSARARGAAPPRQEWPPPNLGG